MSEGPSVRDLIEGKPNIRLIELRQNLPLGLKRNFCCEHARGEVIAHWDDDDWSHPQRLAEQIEILNTGAQVTGYFAMPFDGPGDQAWMYQSHEQYALGTSLTYRKSWWQKHRFPAEQIGEDTAFVRNSLRVLISRDGRERMVATSHPQNTSPRLLRGRQWKPINRNEFPPEYNAQ